MSDDIRPTNQIAYGVDIYDASHALLVDSSTNLRVVDQAVVSQLQTLNSLVPTQYDFISLAYTASNLTTVVYHLGGSGGAVVSTLALGYDGSNNLTSVTKS